MEIKIKRYSDNGKSTLGLLFIDGKFQCYTLEDEERTVKKYAETRIPEGTYEVVLRKEGGHHNRYSKKFPDIHKGMLCICNKPDYVLENNGLRFQYILIHIGNDEDDTAGCPLVGAYPSSALSPIQKIQNSTFAYKHIYPKIAKYIESHGCATITIEDHEK